MPTRPYTESRLSPDNAALLLIDHQTGIMQLVHDYSPAEFRNSVLALAAMGLVYKLPTVLTTSYEDGPNGPLLGDIARMYPKAPLIKRPGEISAWDNPDFVAAVRATGRPNLIMAGVTTDVCLAFPAMQAVDEGFNVYAVIDASGAYDVSTQRMAVERMSRAGVTCTNWVAIAAELQRDWRLPTGEHLGRVFHSHYQDYSMLIESHQRGNA